MEPGQTPNDAFNAPANTPPSSPTPPQPMPPTQYQPTPQQPYVSPQPAPMPQRPGSQFFQPAQPMMQPQPAPVMPMVMAPEQKKGKWLLLTVAVVLVLVVLAGGVFLLLGKKKPQQSTSTTSNGVTHSYASSENAAFTTLKSSNSLTSSALSAVNKTDLFYAVFRNASEQPIVTTTMNRYWTPQLNGTPLVSSESNVANITQGGYDYKTGQLSFQSSFGGVVDKCVNGVDYDSVVADSSPWAASVTGNGDCQLANTTAEINDGLNTGGLSASQAQNFVDSIRDIQGLVDVTNASMVTEQGKSYIRLDATIDANTDCYPHSVPSGAGCFGVAFNYLKLPKSWPDSVSSTIVSGAHLAYFVDPTTQLPAYMQIDYTPVSATQGNWENQQVEYSFGPLPTFQLVNGTLDPVTISWPVTQL